MGTIVPTTLPPPPLHPTQWRSQEKRLGMAKILGSDIDNSRWVKRGFLAKPTLLSYRLFEKKTQSIGGGFSHPGHPPGYATDPTPILEYYFYATDYI